MSENSEIATDTAVSPTKESPFQMPLADAMRTQRAIRRLTDEPVEDALVLELIELAMKAPSGSNQQHWEWIVVKDREVKQRLGQLNSQMFNLYGGIGKWLARDNEKQMKIIKAVQWQADHFADVPVVVVACLKGMRPVWPSVMATSYYGSVYPSVQNLLLAARSAGLGAALITMPLWSSFLARRALGLPWNVNPCAVIPIGWPKGRYGPTTRPPVGTRVHLDRFGNQPFRE